MDISHDTTPCNADYYLDPHTTKDDTDDREQKFKMTSFALSDYQWWGQHEQHKTEQHGGQWLSRTQMADPADYTRTTNEGCFRFEKINYKIFERSCKNLLLKTEILALIRSLGFGGITGSVWTTQFSTFDKAIIYNKDTIIIIPGGKDLLIDICSSAHL